MINDVKDVPYVMSTYENPWETFDSYLENRDVAPAEASGVMLLLTGLFECMSIELKSHLVKQTYC